MDPDFFVELVRIGAKSEFLAACRLCDPEELDASKTRFFTCPRSMSFSEFEGELKALFSMLVQRDRAIYKRSLKIKSLTMIQLALYREIPFDDSIIADLSEEECCFAALSYLITRFGMPKRPKDLNRLVRVACPAAFVALKPIRVPAAKAPRNALIAAALDRDDCSGVRFLLGSGFKIDRRMLLAFAFQIHDCEFLGYLLDNKYVSVHRNSFRDVVPPEKSGNDEIDVAEYIRYVDFRTFVKTRGRPR